MADKGPGKHLYRWPQGMHGARTGCVEQASGNPSGALARMLQWGRIRAYNPNAATRLATLPVPRFLP